MTKEEEIDLSRENLNSIIDWLFEELRSANETIRWYQKKCKMQTEYIRYKSDIFSNRVMWWDN